MTVEEFLINNASNFTDDEYNAAVADLGKMDEAAWLDRYSKLMQEKGARWNEVDIVKAKPLATRLREAFGDYGFAPGKAYLEDVFAKDFEKDVPRPQFNEALAKMKEYYDQEMASREKEAGRIRRQKEVKDWNPIKQALTSDYEKQRYIDDPESALFGEEAPAWFTAEDTRWGSAADLGLGAAGTVADAIPGWGSLAGPAVRLGRDVGHRITDSPYQKSSEDILRDALVDVGLTASTAWLPNFRREKRMLEEALPEAMGRQMRLARESENTLKGINVLDQVVNSGTELEKQFGSQNLNRYFRETVQELPDSYLKQDLLPLVSQPNIDWARAQAIVNSYKPEALLGITPKGYDAVHAIVDNNLPFPRQAADIENADRVVIGKDGKRIGITYPDRYDQLTMDIYNARPLSPLQQKLMKPATALSDVLRGDVGGAAIQIGKTVTGARSPYGPDRVKTMEDMILRNKIIEQEERFWKAKFKPQEVKGDPLWEAYEEWKKVTDEGKKPYVQNVR